MLSSRERSAKSLETLYKEDVKRSAEDKAFLEKQITAYKEHERKNKEKRNQIEQEEKAAAEQARQRAEARAREKEERRLWQQQFLANQPKKESSSSDSDEEAKGASDAAADVKGSGDKPRTSKRAKQFTVAMAGALLEKLNDKEIQEEIERQLKEGRELVAALGENPSELKIYALLGKLGQILEAMKVHKTFNGNPQFERVAEAVRNSIFHGDTGIIPNFDKESSAEVMSSFLERLHDTTLRLISNAGELLTDKAKFSTQAMPEFFSSLALRPIKDVDCSKLTGQALFDALEKHKPKGQKSLVHDENECVAQLKIYCNKLYELRRMKTGDSVVVQNAIGYLLARIDVYLEALKGIKPDNYGSWFRTVKAAFGDFKSGKVFNVSRLGKMYRHNRLFSDLIGGSEEIIAPMVFSGGVLSAAARTVSDPMQAPAANANTNASASAQTLK